MVRGAGGFFPQTPDKGILFEIFSGRILSRLAEVETKKNKRTTLRKGTYRSFIIHLLDNMLCGSRDLTHTVERCGLQLKGVAHSWEKWLTAGRCGSQLGDVAHSWEMWFTVATTRQRFCDILQYNKKCFAPRKQNGDSIQYVGKIRKFVWP